MAKRTSRLLIPPPFPTCWSFSVHHSVLIGETTSWNIRIDFFFYSLRAVLVLYCTNMLLTRIILQSEPRTAKTLSKTGPRLKPSSASTVLGVVFSCTILYCTVDRRRTDSNNTSRSILLHRSILVRILHVIRRTNCTYANE